MTASGPWSVKGIDPKAREIAKDLARRSGLTLGDWLNQMIIEGGEAEAGQSAPPLAATTTAPRRALDDLYREAQVGHRPGARPTLSESEAMRTTRVLESLASRVEAGEHRAALAIGGIDQSMLEVLARLDELDRDHLTTGARLSTVLGEVRSAQAAIAERLSRTPETSAATEALEALQAGLARLEARMDAAAASAAADEDGTKATSEALARRLDRVETVVEAAPAAYADAEKVETVLTRMAERLDHNDTKTDAALQSLNTSFANLDARLRSGEARLANLGGQDLERRFQSLAHELTQKVDAARAEMANRLRHAADGRLDKVETNLRELGGQMELAEKRSAQAIDRIGREVMRVAHNLGERVASTEHAGAELVSRTDVRMAELEARTEAWAGEIQARGAAAAEAMAGEMSRVADAMEARLRDADTAQANALEKLGGEIERIAERLAERISTADRRQAEAMDDVTDKVAKIGARFDERQDQVSGELADRIRASETRTAQLLDDARGSLGRTLPGTAPSMGPAAEVHAPFVAPPPPLEDDHDVFGLGAPSDHLEPEPAAEPAFKPATPLSNADPFDIPAPDPAEPSTRPEPNWGSEADPFGRTPEPHEDSPFNPDDDFAPAAAGATHEPVFAPALFDEMPVREAAAATPPVSLGEPFEPAFTGFSVSDFAPAAAPAEPEPLAEPRPDQLSTRQMLDAARQAARRAAMGKAGEAPADGSVPVPPRDGKAPRPFGITFPGRRKKETAPTLRTFVLASGIAGSLTAMGVGAYLMGGTAHQGAPPSSELAANGPDGALAPSAAPNAAIALTPLPTSPAAAAPAKSIPAAPHLSALPTAKAKAEAVPAKSAPAPASATPAQLYAAAVGRLEGGDLTALGDVRAAADKGLPSAQFYLARLYDQGAAGLAKDPVQARHWTERAAEGGNASAMYNLASYYYGGEGGAKDPGKAAEWFRKAAERGVVNSQYNLAQLYEKGYGVPQSDADAYKWYLVAAGSGDNDSRVAAAALKPKLPADAQAGAEHAAASLRAGLEDGVKTAAATSPNP